LLPCQQPELESSLEERLANPEDLFEGLIDLAALDTAGSSSAWQPLQQQHQPALAALQNAKVVAGSSARVQPLCHAVALHSRATAGVLLQELEKSMAAAARARAAAATRA
jgi:hypothetical protein